MNKQLLIFSLIGFALLTGAALLATHKNNISTQDYSECVKLGTYIPDVPNAEGDIQFSFYTIQNTCNFNLQFEVVSELIAPPSITETGCVVPSETVKTVAITFANIYVSGKLC
ncbi:hypothetical protein ABPG74_002532 [Tetrahymena malaccensis]